MARPTRQFILIMSVLVVMIAMLVVVDWFYLFRHGRDGRLKPGSVTEVPQ